MSDYFDGLMRSSGLSLGRAPVLGPAAGVAPLLMEVDAEVSAALPLVGPLAVTAQAVQHAIGTAPAGRAAALPAQPRSTADPLPPAESSRSVPPLAPPLFAAATAPAPARVEAPPGEVISPSAVTAAPAARPAAAPPISRERIIEAALRWVAAGPVPGATEPGPASARTAVAAAAAPVGPENATDAVPTAPHMQATTAPAIVPPIEAGRTARAAAAEIRSPLRLPAAPLRRMTPARDDTVQVSIGAIHLRVETPAPPVVQTAPPVKRPPVPDVPATPTSSLSRRALPRI